MSAGRRHSARRMIAWVAMLGGCLRPPSAEAPVEAEATDAKVADEAEPIEIPEGPERPDEASPRRIEHSWMSLAEWRRRHERQLAHPDRERAQLVVLGDSIVEAWCQSQAFESAFGDYSPLGLGVGGDQTQHVLWRIDQGALDGLEPRMAMILIGVNNLGNGFSPEETLGGIRRLVARTREKLPSTPVLLLAVLPAGQTPNDDLRRKIEATNARLDELAIPGEVTVAEVGAVLLEPDGTIAATTMGDFLHPTPAGYAKLSEAVKPYVEQIAPR